MKANRTITVTGSQVIAKKRVAVAIELKVMGKLECYGLELVLAFRPNTSGPGEWNVTDPVSGKRVMLFHRMRDFKGRMSVSGAQAALTTFARSIGEAKFVETINRARELKEGEGP